MLPPLLCIVNWPHACSTPPQLQVRTFSEGSNFREHIGESNTNIRINAALNFSSTSTPKTRDTRSMLLKSKQKIVNENHPFNRLPPGQSRSSSLLLHPQDQEATMNEADTWARASWSRAAVAPPINSPSPFRKDERGTSRRTRPEPEGKPNPTAPPRPALTADARAHLNLPPPAGAGGPPRQLLSSGPVGVWVRPPLFAALRQRPPNSIGSLWLARFSNLNGFTLAPFVFLLYKIIIPVVN